MNCITNKLHLTFPSVCLPKVFIGFYFFNSETKNRRAKELILQSRKFTDKNYLIFPLNNIEDLKIEPLYCYTS